MINSPTLGRNILTLIVISVACLIAWLYQVANNPKSADFILLNGTIVTVNPQYPTAEAVAVKGDKILAVGTLAQIEKHRSVLSHDVDLNGKTLMPGFIEPHTHPVAAAVLSDWVDVSGFSHSTPEGVYQALREAGKRAPAGKIVYAFGLDPVLTPGLTPPDKHKLDGLVPNNPLFILSQVMHTAYANSAALQLNGLNKDTLDPQGGHFERDANGELNGIAHENAVKSLMSTGEASLFTKLGMALDMRSKMINQYQLYAQHGYTTISATGAVPMFEGYLDLLEHVATRNTSPIRSYVYPMAGEIEKTDYISGYTNGLYKVLGVKFYIDGSPWTGGMATDQAYLMNEFTQDVLNMPLGNRGQLKMGTAELDSAVQKYHDQGWQIAAHTHGERAHELMLNSLAKAQKESSQKGSRHRLEHLGLIGKDDILRARQLGVTLSFFIDHITFFGDTIRDRLLGAERAERFMPLKTATQLHEQVSIHTDSPSAPLGVIRAMKAAVTRVPANSTKPIGLAERMDVIDVIEAVTIDAAWQLHAEDQIGSIEVGKYADFTLLSGNLLETNPEDWLSISVVGTWLAGKPVMH